MNERTLRILFVGGALSGGGAERQLLQLATALHTHGHRVTVTTITQGNFPVGFRHVILWNGKRRNKIGALCGIAGAIVRLCKIWEIERPDVIVGWQTVPIIIASAIGRYYRTPFVAAIRSSVPEKLPRLYQNKIRHSLLGWMLRKAELIVANSQAGIDGYIRLGIINRDTGTRVIPNGINTFEFQAADKSTAVTTRNKLGVLHHGPLALYVGRIAAEKNIPLLLRVIDATLAVRPDLSWLVVGIEREKFLSIANALDINLSSERITFIPRLVQMPLAYQSSDLLCLTSSHEGSPNCVLEARACGIPVISTDCGDVRERMRPNDHIVAADVASFTNALNKILAQPSLQPREGAQALSIEGSATQWLEMLQSVARGVAELPQHPQSSNFSDKKHSAN